MSDRKIFTQHIQCLLAGDKYDGTQLIDYLRNAVVRRLKKLGQWNLPPSYLGYQGETWGHSSALDDLIQDSYIACVLKPLKSGRYAEILQASDTVEGYVHWKLKLFLIDRQRQGNPIGVRIFKNIKTASRHLVESQRATASGDTEFSHTTVVLANQQTSPTTKEQLAVYFVDELVKLEFARTFCIRNRKSQLRIEDHISGQFQCGLTGFVIGELSSVCTEIVTQTLRSANYDPNICIESFDTEDFWIASRIILDDDRYSNLDELRKNLRNYVRTIRKIIPNQRIRKRVHRMLRFLAVNIVRGEDDRNLSQAQIATELGVSKSTLNEDVARVRRAITELVQDAPERDKQL